MIAVWLLWLANSHRNKHIVQKWKQLHYWHDLVMEVVHMEHVYPLCQQEGVITNPDEFLAMVWAFQDSEIQCPCNEQAPEHLQYTCR